MDSRVDYEAIISAAERAMRTSSEREARCERAMRATQDRVDACNAILREFRSGATQPGRKINRPRQSLGSERPSS